MKNQILLLEDDINIAKEIISNLEEESYALTHVRTLLQLKSVDVNQFDLLIFDWNLPDGESIDQIREYRKKNIETPILILSARTQLEDRKKAIDYGASDFLGKPFYFHELSARVSILIGGDLKGTKKKNEVIKLNDIELKVSEREVWFQDNLLSLTLKEFDLLLFLMRNPKIVFSRDEILDAVWGRLETPTHRTIDNHILQLRKKMKPEYFETVWNAGYRFILGKNNE